MKASGFLAKLCVEGSGGFGGDGLFECFAFFFSLATLSRDADEHVVELGELRLVADGAVAGDDDGVGGGGGEIFFGGADHAVDVASAKSSR